MTDRPGKGPRWPGDRGQSNPKTPEECAAWLEWMAARAAQTRTERAAESVGRRMVAPLESNDVTEIVTIIENESDTHLSGDEVARRVVAATEDYRRDFAAQNRRDMKEPLSDFETAASKVRNALDVILAHIAPEAGAESPTLARLADHLSCHLENPNRMMEIVVRLLELRDATDRTLEDAARYKLADVSGDPEAETVSEADFRLKGKKANLVLDQYLLECTTAWSEATGKEFALREIGGDTKRKGEITNSPRAQYMHTCLRLIGDASSLKTIRGRLRKLKVQR